MISPTAASPCQSCGALIFMVAHARTGKAAPINVGPDPAGNIRLELTNSGRAAYPDNVIPFPARKTSQTGGERR